MASTIKVDEIEGSTGSTVTVPTGQTFTVTDGIAIGSLPTITAVKGGTGQTGFAAGDLLYANSTTTLAKLTASGHGSKTLKMNSGATAPEWATVTAAADYVQLANFTATSGETLDVDGYFSSILKLYILAEK